MLPKLAKKKNIAGQPIWGGAGRMGASSPAPGFAMPKPGPAPSAVNRAQPAPAPIQPTQPLVPQPTVQSAAARINAQGALGRANTGYRDSVFQAAMQLGDPTVLAALQNDPNFAGYTFAQDPNSTYASTARDEADNIRNIGQSANAANTYFSGQRLTDEGKAHDAASRALLAGDTAYLANLRQFASALGAANDTYRQGMADADQSDINYALQFEPQAVAGRPSPMPLPRIKVSNADVAASNAANAKAQAAANAAKQAQTNAKKKAKRK